MQSVKELAPWLAEAVRTGFLALAVTADVDDPIRGQMAGIALSTGPGRGCYVPLRHAGGGDQPERSVHVDEPAQELAEGHGRRTLATDSDPGAPDAETSDLGASDPETSALGASDCKEVCRNLQILIRRHSIIVIFLCFQADPLYLSSIGSFLRTSYLVAETRRATRMQRRPGWIV